MSSQSKAQVTHKRQWKAPQATNFNDDYNQDTSDLNQKTGNFNSLVNDNASREEVKTTSPERNIPETVTSGAKKSLFGGSKKNVFNPFAKKTGKPLGTGENTSGVGSAVGNSFTKESNIESDNRFGAP